MIPNLLITVFGAIVSSNEGENATVAGASLLRQPLSISSGDGGQTWSKSTTTAFSSTFRQAQQLDNDDIYLFGTWSKLEGLKSIPGDGFAVSTDHGNSYTLVNWPYIGVTPIGGTVIGDLIYVAGSSELEDESSQLPFSSSLPSAFPLSSANPKLLQQPPQPVAQAPVFYSYVTVTSDGGSTWKTIWSSEGTIEDDIPVGISLGAIQFVSEQVGFVSGRNRTVSGNAAILLGTVDGGSTWKTLLNVEKGVFTKINCISTTECFVVGAAPCDCESGNAVVYHTQDAGQTFSQTLIPGVLTFLDLSYVSEDVMYATAMTKEQSCDLFGFGYPPDDL